MRLLLFVLSLSVAYGGTGVGNFNFKTQMSFDFRIGYPSDWKWSEQAVTGAEEKELWLITNVSKVAMESKASWAKVSFLSPFPASDKNELLAEITRRHPGTSWNPITNPDFSIGFVSDQTFIGTGRTRSFEYYFSGTRKVVRIETERDRTANGASEVDVILSTIRRPSGQPEVVSISMVDTGPSLKVGDQACYRIEVNRLRGDFVKESLTGFEVKGAPAHWSFKTVTWNASDSNFKVCLKVTARFPSDGLRITSLSLVGANGTMLTCFDSSSSRTALYCGEYINYQVPEITGTVVNSGPKILGLSLGRQSHLVNIDVQSSFPLAMGKLTTAQTSGFESESFLIYPEQLKLSKIEVALDQSRLQKGFTRIAKVELIDEVGNAVQLRAGYGASHYTLYSTDQDPVETQIPILSVIGGEQ